MRKKMTKKLLAALLTASVSIGLLAGCGGTTTTTTTDTGEASSSEAAATASDDAAGETSTSGTDKTTISIYRCTYNLATPDTAQVQKVQDAINEYIADKINVEIKITDLASGEYGDKANLALANNEINLLWTASWWATIGYFLL